MKNYFKSLAVMLAVFLLAGFMGEAFAQQPGIISAPGGTSQIPSDYVDITIPDDPVYIFCSPNANGDTVSGSLSVNGGFAVCDFEWRKYDEDIASPTYQQFLPFFTETGQPSSSVTGLESGFYQVFITTNPGAVNENFFCRRAHVFVNETVVNFDSIAPGCQPFTLTGGIINALNDFTIYDPPPTPFVVDSTTIVKVCFWADHTYVSDLGFYLIGPGGNRVDLMPPISAWDQGAQVTLLDISVVTDCDPLDYYTNCNSGNNVQEFCFTSALPAGDPSQTPCLCDMPTPLTGTFASCGPWDGIYGNMASNGGWKVQIYDCTPADIGYLQKVTMSFTGQSDCGLTTYEYTSGAINVTINDNACTPQTAATYTVPLKGTSQHTITNEVTAEWSVSPGTWNPNWGSQTFNPLVPPVIDPQPLISSYFCLTINDHLYDTLGNEILQSSFPLYNSCEPKVCRYYETLPVDATIDSYPQYICNNAPPTQLLPLFSGGSWTANGQTWPNGPITTNGWFYPTNAPIGVNTITYAFGGVCADSETVTINVVDAPVVSNVVRNCNGTNTMFNVSFNVVGGNPGSYQITHSSSGNQVLGSWTATTFTTNWMPNGTNYSFIVTDAEDCDPDIVQGVFDCNCTSSSANMPSALISLCQTDETNVQYLPNSTYTLDANDNWEYFLHTNQFGVLGTVLGHNNTGVFGFDPATMNFEQVYYISHVVGNNTSIDPLDPEININDSCLSVSQGTPVKWYQLPVADAGTDDFICGKTIQLQATPATVGVGTWTCTTTTGVIYSPNFNNPSASAIIPFFDSALATGCLLNTNHTFRWTVNNGPCQHFNDVEMTFKPIPNAFAGNDFSICGYEANLTAQWSSLCGPIGQSDGEWYGPGIITDPTNLTTEVNVNNAGQYTWIWRESNGECYDEDYVSITFIQQPIVDANHDDIACGNQYELNAISTMGVGFWTGPPNTSFFNPTSPSSIAQIATSGLSEVIVDFIWTEQNAFCTASDTVTITYSAVPHAAAGLSDGTCDTAYTFDADILGYEYAVGTWKTDFVTADFDDNHDPNATVYLPNTNSFPGQVQAGTFGDSSWVQLPFVWVMDNNSCTDEDTIMIEFYQVPKSNPGPDTSVCGKSYTMRAQYSIGASQGKWTVVNSPSGVPPTWVDDTDPTTTVQVPSYGEYIFQWKEDNLNNPTCSDSKNVVVYFIEIPDVDAGPDKYICGEDTYLEAVASTGNGEWLANQAFITDITDPNSPTHFGLTGTNETVTYIWQEYNAYGGVQCVSTSEVDIVFMIVPDAQVFFTPGTSTDHVCGKTEKADNIIIGKNPLITGSNVSAYWSGNDATFYYNGVVNTGARDPDSVVVGNYGVHEFVWVIENHQGDSVCPDTSISIIVDFIEQPVADAGLPADVACIYEVGDSLSLYQLDATWSVNPAPGDSLAGKWITSSPNQVSFWYIDPIELDTFLNDTAPDDWVLVEYINSNNPIVYDLIWQEELWGNPINGNPRDKCTDTDITSVTFAPRPIGKIEITPPDEFPDPADIKEGYHPHCIGYPAKFKARDDYEIVDWDWSDLDDGVLIHSATAGPDGPGKGPIYVKWPNAVAGQLHFVRLITENIWGCKSSAAADTIFEPQMVDVDIDIEPAKCGEANGEIVLLPDNTVLTHTYNWVDSLQNSYLDHSADKQIELMTGDHFFYASARSKVKPNDSATYCTDLFTVHIPDTGYVASLFQVSLADTSGISPHSVQFTNLTYATDSSDLTPSNIPFSQLILENPPFEELDAEYEWRFYHIPYDSLPDFNAPIEIFPWEDPIEINGETFFEDVNPSITFEAAGHYKIEMVAISEFGCRDTFLAGYLFTDAESDIDPVVNVFTPNGDGQNDFLEFNTQTLRSMKGQIFNRYGRLIYEWTWNEADQEPNPGWWDGKLDNGQDASAGVYFFIIEAVGQDGTTFSEKDAEGNSMARAFHLIR